MWRRDFPVARSWGAGIRFGGGEVTDLRAWIEELPPDAIARVVNAYRDAYDDLYPVKGTRTQAHRAGCAAFRATLLSLAPSEELP